jgi:hypothetical protein
MTQEQIQQASKALASLTPEQKESFKQQFMTDLGKIDNIGEISDELARKIQAGGLGDTYLGGIFGDIREKVNIILSIF